MQESLYLLNNVIEQNLIDFSITKGISSVYFAHYKTKEECKYYIYKDPFCESFLRNIEELSKNDWELHKR